MTTKQVIYELEHLKLYCSPGAIAAIDYAIQALLAQEKEAIGT